MVSPGRRMLKAAGSPPTGSTPDAGPSHRPGPSQDRRVPVTVATMADLVKLARRTRTFVTDPAKLWCVRRDPEHDILQGVRFHAPDALDYFGPAAVLAAALTTGTVCRWCQAFARAATAGKRLPTNEAMLELLGRPCRRCAPVIFRQVTASLEAAMAAPLDVPFPGSVNAGHTRVAGDRESARLSATGHRPPTPEPSYYQRRPWPAEGTR
jgi:hypothetical protein